MRFMQKLLCLAKHDSFKRWTAGQNSKPCLGLLEGFSNNAVVVKILISLNFVPLLYRRPETAHVPVLRSLASNHSLPLSREKKWLSKGFVKKINLNHCSYKIYEALTKKCQAWIIASKAPIHFLTLKHHKFKMRKIL